MRTPILLALATLTACNPYEAQTVDTVRTVDGVVEGPDTPDTGADVVDGAWLVRVDGSLDDAELQARLAELGASGLTAVEGTPNTYRFQSSAPPTTVSQLSELDASVGWVEPVIRYHALAAAPNDPYFGYQWHHGLLGTLDGWDVTQGEGIIVAVVDTGVHTLDIVPDGPVNRLPGISYVNSTFGEDDVGHGTHIANIIAQNANNGISAAGIAPGVSILPVRVMGPNGGTSDDIAAGIRWAVDNGAHIVNLSLGGDIYSDVIAEACQYAVDSGAIVFAASGNGGADHFVSFPAALDSTVAVGAVGPDNLVTDYSNRGPEIDLMAPGGVWYDYDRNGLYDGVLADTVVEIIGDPNYEDGWYGVAQFQVGTSMATGAASASAAMLLSAGADRDTALQLLCDTAVDGGEPGWDPIYGHGSIDIAAAIAALDADPIPDPDPDPVCAADACGEDVGALSVKIVEVMANPKVCADAHGEWLEIVNNSSLSISLDGLIIEDAGGGQGTLSTDAILWPGERTVLGRGNLMAFCGPDVQGSFGDVSLNNSGEQLTLRTPSGATIDAAPAWSGTSPGFALERNGDSWDASTTPMGEDEFGTPGFEAEAPAEIRPMSYSIPGDFTITEVMANPSICGNDSCEWIEIRNDWVEPFDLDGMEIGDAGGIGGLVVGSVIVQPGAKITLGRGDATSWAHPDFTPDGFYGGVMLNNAGDTVVLAYAEEMLFEMATYGSAHAQSGVSMELTGADALDIASWTPSTTALPSGELASPGL